MSEAVELEAAVGSLSIPEAELWFIVGEKGQKYPGPGKIHALCGPVGGDHEAESIADALLFAASRELLAACKAEEIAEQAADKHALECAYSGCDFKGCPHDDIWKALKDAKAMRRAAIAKAEPKGKIG